MSDMSKQSEMRCKRCGAPPGVSGGFSCVEFADRAVANPKRSYTNGCRLWPPERVQERIRYLACRGAAPDMLDALERLLVMFGGDPLPVADRPRNTREMEAEAIDRARTVIAKARGAE